METQLAGGQAEVPWQPTMAQADATRLAAYQRGQAAERGVHLRDCAALWQWSVSDIETSWQTDGDSPSAF